MNPPGSAVRSYDQAHYRLLDSSYAEAFRNLVLPPFHPTEVYLAMPDVADSISGHDLCRCRRFRHAVRDPRASRRRQAHGRRLFERVVTADNAAARLKGWHGGRTSFQINLRDWQ